MTIKRIESGSRIKNGIEETIAEARNPRVEQKYMTANKRKKEPAKLVEILSDKKLIIETKIDRNKDLFKLNFKSRIFIDINIIKVKIIINESIFGSKKKNKAIIKVKKAKSNSILGIENNFV